MTDRSVTKQKKAPKLTPEQKRRHKALAFVKDYVRTYNKQVQWDRVSEDTFIKDMIYGIGVGLDAKAYSFADGFDRFQARLREMLEPKEKTV